MTFTEKACLLALTTFVPKFYTKYLTYEGWKERVVSHHLFWGIREEVLKTAYEKWKL